jgi:hypothetical protein
MLPMLSSKARRRAQTIQRPQLCFSPLDSTVYKGLLQVTTGCLTKPYQCSSHPHGYGRNLPLAMRCHRSSAAASSAMSTRSGAPHPSQGDNPSKLAG